MPTRIASPAQQGYRQHVTSRPDERSLTEAFEAIIDAYQRQIDEKREELAKLSRGNQLASAGYVRLAIVHLLREMSPHVMPYEAMQIYLWGYESDANAANLKVQVSNIRKTRYGLSEDERIECLSRVGYRMVRRAQ